MSSYSLARRAILAAGAAALIAPSAGAQGTFFGGGSFSGCGGDKFTSCALWSAALSNGNKTLTLSVTNTTGLYTGNTNSVFTQVILGNLGSLGTNHLASNGFSVSGPGDWSTGSAGFQLCSASNLCGLSGQGLVANAFGAKAHGNDGIGAGETGIFQFTFTQELVPANFSAVQLGFHDQGTPSGFNCTTNKPVFDGTTGTPTPQTASPPCGPGVSTVPEPASTGLLTLGLSALGGIGGIGRLRRRLFKQS